MACALSDIGAFGLCLSIGKELVKPWTFVRCADYRVAREGDVMCGTGRCDRKTLEREGKEGSERREEIGRSSKNVGLFCEIFGEFRASFRAARAGFSGRAGWLR